MFYLIVTFKQLQTVLLTFLNFFNYIAPASIFFINFIGKDDNGSPTQQCDGDNDYWCPEGMGPSGVLDPICSPKCEYTKGTVYNELVKGQISCACGLNGCNNVTGLFCTEDSSLCSERRSSCNEGMTAETAVNCEVITERCTCSKCKEGYFSAICEKCKFYKTIIYMSKKIVQNQ